MNTKILILIFTFACTVSSVYSQHSFKFQIIKNSLTDKYYLADEMGEKISNEEWSYISDTPNFNPDLNDSVLSDKSLHFTVSDGKKKYYIDLLGECLATFKSYKKKIYDQALLITLTKAKEGKYDDIYKRLIEAHEQKLEKEKRIALRQQKLYQEQLREEEARKPVPIQKNGLWGIFEKGFEYEKGGHGKVIEPAIYKTLIPIGHNFLASENGDVFQILSNVSSTNLFIKLQTKYTIQELADGGYIMTSDTGECGVMNKSGDFKINCDFDEIIPIKIDGKIFFYIAKQNKWGWASLDSGILQACIFDYIGDFNQEQAVVIYNGYQGTMNLSGKMVKGLAENLFNKANKESHAIEDRIVMYQRAIELDKVFNEGYAGSCYNNIGVIYENAGDLDMALAYYERAKELGDKTGKANYRNLRMNQTLSKWQAVANTLSDIGNSLINNTTGNNVGNINQNTGSVYYSNTDNEESQSGYSETYYQTQYSNWERIAKSNYETLTNLGYRYQKDNGERTGGTMQSMSSSNYTRQKKYLREAQNEMKKIRVQARKDGITIPQSTYETATVSY